MNTHVIKTFNPELPVHMTFNEHDWHILAQHWYPVALSREISDQPIAALLLDMPLVLYRMNDELIVAKDICLHRRVLSA